MFSVVPGLDDSDVVSSESESECQPAASREHDHDDVGEVSSASPSVSAAVILPAQFEEKSPLNSLEDADGSDVQTECLPPAGISNENWEVSIESLHASSRRH